MKLITDMKDLTVGRYYLEYSQYGSCKHIMIMRAREFRNKIFVNRWCEADGISSHSTGHVTYPESETINIRALNLQDEVVNLTVNNDETFELTNAEVYGIVALII